jgi:hypothetical protein
MMPISNNINTIFHFQFSAALWGNGTCAGPLYFIAFFSPLVGRFIFGVLLKLLDIVNDRPLPIAGRGMTGVVDFGVTLE